MRPQNLQFRSSYFVRLLGKLVCALLACVSLDWFHKAVDKSHELYMPWLEFLVYYRAF